MTKQDLLNKQIGQLNEFVSTLPNHGQEEKWLLAFNKLIDEIKVALSPHVRCKLTRIDLGCYDILEKWGSNYVFVGPSIKSINMLDSLLEDEVFYYSSNEYPDEAFLKKKKLLEARRESVDFEDDLAVIICGDNEKFPYRSSWYITKFFRDIGFDYQHDGSTRATWIASVLYELNIHDIYRITEAVFRKKYFVDYSKIKELDLDTLITEAREEFSDFLENSISANQTIDTDAAYKLNVNLELLTNKSTSTEDNIFNELIDSAKNFYIEGRKQEAIEKVWDAFERLKSINIPTDKKASVAELIGILSNELDKSFFESEFRTLTQIGNNYMIRHSETDKIPLNDNSNKDYLFFRILALIDLAIKKVPRNNNYDTSE